MKWDWICDKSLSVKVLELLCDERWGGAPGITILHADLGGWYPAATDGQVVSLDTET